MHRASRPVLLAFLIAFIHGCAGGGHRTLDSPPGSAERAALRLPTGVYLDPAGRSIAVGNMPLGALATHDGRFLVVSLSGWREQGIEVIDRAAGRVVQRLAQRGAFLGLAWGADARTLYVAGGSADVIYVYAWDANSPQPATLSDSLALGVPGSKTPRYPAGLSLSDDGHRLYVAENLADSLAVVDLSSRRVVRRLGAGPYPYAVVSHGARVYVSAWGADFVSVFEADEVGNLRARHPVSAGRQPSALVLSRDGRRLFAASASTDRVAVIDTRAGRVLRWLNDAPPGGVSEGSTPNALALSADGWRLFVAEADANAIAIFELSSESCGDSSATGDDRLVGRIPAEWYPTAVISSGDSLCVVNGKGRGAGPNPTHGHPGDAKRPPGAYVLGQLNGTITVAADPRSNAALLNGSERVAVANGWNSGTLAPKRKYPPFQHVIYIIKENRTYDQVFGDLAQADGDTALLFFPRAVTPNHHALAERFGIFDRFFVNSEVSNQGHPWSTAAYVTDFLEKTTPDLYRGTRAEHDDAGDADDPAAGYLWDTAIRRGITLRNYGEYGEAVAEDAAGPARTRALIASLEPYTHPTYPPYDLSILDQRRADIWIEELHTFDAAGGMPALQILHLPNDHTSGARAGRPTPKAHVADNDLALGRIIEALSRSRFWKDTVVFTLEDDAQDGPDHVDSHRSVLLVVSAYNRGGVLHRFVNTTDVLATIEEILGLDPLSHFDRFGRPLREVWSSDPDLTPYVALTPEQSLTEMNLAMNPDARRSEEMDLSKQDRIDDDAFNRILWRTIKGAERPYPGVRRASVQEYVRAR